MTEKLQQLVDALREELQQYGEALALLDQQQELIKSHTVPQLAELVQAINRQMETIRQARESRTLYQCELAGLLQMDGQNSTLAELSRFVPDEYRLQINALVEENNRLLGRVRQRLRQNHLMLARSMELIQRLLDSLLSTARISMYDESGQLAKQLIGHRSLWNTVA
jgi:flagellar biosynthesis/type III secretory pathway chaperone